jgi:hypothetical protein
MKVRNGFVSNSSSTSYIITCWVPEGTLTLVDFVEENRAILDEFLDEYDWYKEHPEFTPPRRAHHQMLREAAELDITFRHGESKEIIFGDEDGTRIGHVYDYALRSGGSSKHFTWRMEEMLR